MRFRIVVAAYALWLMAIFGVFYAVHGDNENALQLAVIGGVIRPSARYSCSASTGAASSRR